MTLHVTTTKTKYQEEIFTLGLPWLKILSNSSLIFWYLASVRGVRLNCSISASGLSQPLFSFLFKAYIQGNWKEWKSNQKHHIKCNETNIIFLNFFFYKTRMQVHQWHICLYWTFQYRPSTANLTRLRYVFNNSQYDIQFTAYTNFISIPINLHLYWYLVIMCTKPYL